MPSGRARFTGGRVVPAYLDGNHRESRLLQHTPKLYFSTELRTKLRSYYPGDEKPDPVFGDPADEFVELVLNEANWATPWVAEIPFRLTGDELRAEHRALLASLKKAHLMRRNQRKRFLSALEKTKERLERISPDLDRLLDPNAEPLRCADLLGKAIDAYTAGKKHDFTECGGALASMIRYAEEAGPRTRRLPDKRKPAGWRHFIANEISLRVLRVLYRDYGITPSATAGEYTSTAVEILKLIGDDIGLVLAEKTWRSIIAAVKKEVLNPPQLGALEVP